MNEEQQTHQAAPQSTKLRSLSDIKNYFAQSTRPYFFFSATNFNVLGMHEWVRSWHNINLLDCFDGRHPSITVIPDDYSQIFESIEDINAYLLKHPSTLALLQAKQSHEGQKNQAVFLFFDPKIESICEEMNLEVVLPRHEKVREIDSKIVTTQIGNQAGVASVPNVLTKVNSYAELVKAATAAQLGSRWVVQTAYGDSGKTTFFIASEADYDAVADQIEGEAQVKIMKWIRCTGAAIEACATRWGTFVGPLMTELIGIGALTPYPGGWCGNELYEAAFSQTLREQVQQKTQRMGQALYERGYRGYFELDYLIDLDSDDIYLGELNARITGISAMTNLSDYSAQTIPLFLFHLLEYDPAVELALDVSSFNRAMLAKGAQSIASQIILKQTEDALRIVVQAPVSGVYALEDAGQLALKNAGHDRRAALASNEAYVLRIMAEGDYAYHGGDLAIMFVNQVIRDPQGGLNSAGQRWTQALQQLFRFRALTQEERAMVEWRHNPAHMKSERTSE